MTRHQTIDQIKSKLDQLTDEQLAVLADMTASFMHSPALALSSDDKVLIDAALARLAAGKGVAWNEVKARLDATLA